MSSARLEILISARDTASQTLAGVKGAFARRTAEIEALGDRLMKNGDKIERFMHGASLAKMATETAGFQKALDAISPSLKGFVNDLTNLNVTAGYAMQGLRDLQALRATALFGPLAVGAAIVGGTVAIGQSYLDMKDEERTTEERKKSRIFQSSEAAKNARSEPQFDQAYRDLVEAGALEIATEILARKRQILASNQAHVKWIQEMDKRNAALQKENADTAANRAAMSQVKAIQRDQFLATPQGQFEAYRDTERNLGDAKRLLAGTDPEKQAVRWLELNATVEKLNAEMEKLKEAPIGKMADFFKTTLPDGIKDLLRPASFKGEAPQKVITETVTRRLESDSFIRQGLAVGNTRSSLEVSSTTTRIATNSDRQVGLLEKILSAVGIKFAAQPSPIGP